MHLILKYELLESHSTNPADGAVTLLYSNALSLPMSYSVTSFLALKLADNSAVIQKFCELSTNMEEDYDIPSL